MKAWLAKDEEGHLFLFQNQPEKREDYWCGFSGFELDLEESDWPEVYEKYKDMENMTCTEVDVDIK